MKKKFLIIVVFLAHISLAQSIDDIYKISSENNEQIEKLVSMSSSFTPSKKAFYIDSDWNHGTILNHDGELIHFNGRINLIRMLVEANVGNRIRKINDDKIAALIINGQKFVRIPGSSIRNEQSSAYMSVLSLGDYILLRKYKIIIKTTGGTSLHPDLTSVERPFLDSDLYYTTRDFTEVAKLGGKSSILSLLKNDKSKVEEFMKINKLKYGSETDVARLFDFYNSLD